MLLASELAAATTRICFVSLCAELRIDPPIPNSCPFKADIISNLLRRKQEREERLLREREERLQQQKKQEEEAAAADVALQADGFSDAKAMKDLADKAESATMAFEAAAAAGPSGPPCG